MTKIAVVQVGTVMGDLEKTFEKLDHYASKCKHENVKLAVFPEAFIGGYPKGVDFGSFGIRNSEGRKRYHTYADNAIKVPSQATQAIGDIARQYGLWLVIGVIEREVSTLYNTVLYFAPDGSIAGKHRSLAMPAPERAIWHAGDGSMLPVIETPLGNLGALTRWENYMPYVRMVMYAKQIEVYCALTVDDSPAWIPTLQHIAREGGCFVLSSCQYLTRDNYPAGWLASDVPEILIRGGSCIVNPKGELIAQSLLNTEGLLMADINMDELVDGKRDFDVIRDFARPDVFNLNFNTNSLGAITTY